MTKSVSVEQALDMMIAEPAASFISVGWANFTSKDGEFFTITRTSNFDAVIDREAVQAEIESNLHFKDGALDLRMNEIDGEIFIVE